MSAKSNSSRESSILKVPWEPYKAATTKKGKSSSQLSLDKNDLIRYNVKTDMKLFNAQRPGYQFDDSDVNFVQKANDSGSFIDARFYTDFQFLKLADELKNKCLEQNTPVATRVSKPVNVVGPMNKISKALDTEEPMKVSKSQMNKYEKKIGYLEDQMKGIYENLQIQTQVNAELKKLLVASVGDDIQYKIERLVNDKHRLAYELENNAKHTDKLSEEIEQCSIKCDLWRSKFLACRLMSDEASTWKSFLLLLNKQNGKVLKSMLADNELINNKLNQALDMLSSLKENESSLLPCPPKIKRCFNNFQAVNMLLLEVKKLSIGNSTEHIQINPMHTDKTKPFLKTENEMVSTQMLEQFDWVNLAMKEATVINNTKPDETNSNLIDSFEKLEQLISRIKVNRTTIHSRLFQTTDMSGDLMLNVCTKCTGKIQIV